MLAMNTDQTQKPASAAVISQDDVAPDRKPPVSWKVMIIAGLSMAIILALAAFSWNLQSSVQRATQVW